MFAALVLAGAGRHRDEFRSGRGGPSPSCGVEALRMNVLASDLRPGLLRLRHRRCRCSRSRVQRRRHDAMRAPSANRATRAHWRLLPAAPPRPRFTAATHLLSTAGPGRRRRPGAGRATRSAIAAAPKLRWIGYLSSTVGLWRPRLAAGWTRTRPPRRPRRGANAGPDAEDRVVHGSPTVVAVDIFRLGRHLRPAVARRSTTCGPVAPGGCAKPGHQFGRIHRDDIAQAVRGRDAAGSPGGPAPAQS